MKKFGLRTLFIYIMAVLSGALLLHTSQNVHKAEEELAEIQASLDREKEAIHVLRTEWAFLNNPERLEMLARQFLKLSPSNPRQIKTDGSEIPARLELPATEPLQAQPVSYQAAPPSKPVPQAVLKASPKEKTLDDLIKQVAEGTE